MKRIEQRGVLTCRSLSESAIIFHGKQPVVPKDGDEAVMDLKLIDAIYLAAKMAKRVGV